MKPVFADTVYYHVGPKAQQFTQRRTKPWKTAAAIAVP